MSTPVPMIFRAGGQPGNATLLQNQPGRIRARKRAILVQVRFCSSDTQVETLEGRVAAEAGDAIVTGSQGEQWPVRLARFDEKYRALAQPGVDGTYQTLPIEVLALTVAAEFTVILSDGESCLHGNAGDWLIDYGDGSLGIVNPAIFNATYEIMETQFSVQYNLKPSGGAVG